MNLIKNVTLIALLAGAASAQAPVCTTVEDGIECGPQLNVSFAPGGGINSTVTVAATGLDPAGVAIMAWGSTAINVPLSSGCNAYTDFLWGHLINPDANGEWSWSRSWPGSVLGMYRIQIAGLSQDPQGGLDITLTNCVVASCL